MTDHPIHSSENSEKNEFKKPEFIIIDETKDYVYGSSRGWAGPEEEELLTKKVKNPFSLRLLCVVGLVITLVFAGGLISYLALLSLFATLCLFRNKSINLALANIWRFFTYALVVAVSLVLAIFSPTLGFTLLVLYFTMKGQGNDRDVLRKILRKFL